LFSLSSWTSVVNEVTAEMMIEKMRLKSDRALSLQQLACCGSHCCMPVHGKDLMVYDHLDRQKEPLLLTGHHRDVSAMTFGHGNILLLCSASADYIVVWDIELCKQKVQQGKVADGIIIGKLLGEVVHLSFCYADERVAVCSGATIYILSSKQQQVILTLTGYLGALTSAEFCPWDPDILVSTSEDRMFRILCFPSVLVYFPKTLKLFLYNFCSSTCLKSMHSFCTTNVFVALCFINHFTKGGIKEQPLVFNSKVKSSGYSSSPQGGSRRRKKDRSGLCKSPEVSIPIKVNEAATVFMFLPLPLCAGHDKPVSSVNWSLSRQWWLSASDDLSLRVWTHCSSEPAIVMGNNAFSKPIRGAQFYYLDKFILLSSGPSLQLYLYHVDDTHDDIKRYQQRSVIKQGRCFQTTSATEITTFSAINDFFSYIVLVCGANRSVQVFDINRGKVACEIPDAHTRAVHCIAQNKGSAFSHQAPDSSNIFLTSAVTDGVKIWDLRTLRCVRRYENHLIRSHPCSSAISPCGRLIATGSEDNCAYVYDIRSSSFLHKLHKHSDTVLSVAFNPAIPEVRRTYCI
uniref:WD repeat domain 27 n=1 Tax=Gouania willdenowi TaxID=441366 RepID=A0A8C5EDJ1_GOUWI